MVTNANKDKDKVEEGNQEPERPVDLQKPKVEPMEYIEEIERRKVEEIPVIKEEAAREIAKILVIGFLILLIAPYLYLLRGSVTEVVDLMKTVAAVLSGLVGAIFGYYFRRGK